MPMKNKALHFLCDSRHFLKDLKKNLNSPHRVGQADFLSIDFYIFYVNYLSKKETENKKVLVGYNGIDGKEVTMSKFKEDINEIRDSRSIYGREVENK